MDREYGKICCIIMASGLSERYGKNKLLEKPDEREVILHTADSLTEAGFVPVTVTRSPEVKALMDREGTACVLHDGPKKSDTMHAGIRYFFRCPEHAVRLGYRDMPGSPVLFPASCREDLLAYEGDRGGMEVIRREQIPCDTVQAEDEWELWDVDTPEKMEKVREIRSRLTQKGS